MNIQLLYRRYEISPHFVQQMAELDHNIHRLEGVTPYAPVMVYEGALEQPKLNPVGIEAKRAEEAALTVVVFGEYTPTIAEAIQIRLERLLPILTFVPPDMSAKELTSPLVPEFVEEYIHLLELYRNRLVMAEWIDLPNPKVYVNTSEILDTVRTWVVEDNSRRADNRKLIMGNR